MKSRSSVCVVVASLNFDRQVGRLGNTLLLLGHRLAAAEGAGNESQVKFTASLLTVLRLISLTVALAEGSARVTGLNASTIIIMKWHMNRDQYF